MSRRDGVRSASEPTNTAACGLPQRLVPSDFGTPEYKAPRRECPAALRDQVRADVQLTLVRWHTRVDWERETEGLATKTTTTRVPEGEYRVSPDTAYGFEPGQLLRVDCSSQTAVTVLEPAG